MNKITDIQLKSLTEEITLRLDDNRLVDSLIREIALLRLELRQQDLKLKQMAAISGMRDLLLPLVEIEVAGRNQLKIEASAPLSADAGFYPLEYDELGKPYRWTGPESSFVFELALDRSVPLEFVLRCLDAGRKTTIMEMRSLVDGEPIFVSHAATDEIISLRGIIPASDTSGYTRIDFEVQNLFVPAELNPDTDDQRRLGVVFFDLTVSPATVSSGAKQPKDA